VPTGARGKKRIAPEEDEDEADKGPDFTLPIVEENGSEDSIESELGEAPTPSALLGGADYDPTITFQTIPMATEARQSMSERPNRRVSHISTMSRDGEDVDDDREVEIGRRAVSEGPVDRYPRTSFGSIRMSDFGLDQRRVSDIAEGNHTEFTAHDDYEFVGGFGDDSGPEYEYVMTEKATQWNAKFFDSNETEDFRRHRRSPSVQYELDIDEPDVIDDNDTFRLEIPVEAEAHSLHSRISPKATNASSDTHDSGEDEDEDEDEDEEDDNEFPPLHPDSSQERTRMLTPIEAAAVHRPRRKRVKLTRHGIAIPALPSKLVKRIAIESMTRQGQRKPTIDRASLKALEQATEWFFEQIGEDLEAYSNHAGRTKRVDASDVVTLIRRQRAVSGKGKLRDIAVEHLPPEALHELRLPEIL
jgi:histone H3/H4